jgi:ferritin
MLSPKIEEALNAQLNAETYSGYLYLAMAAYFENMNLTGFTQWMKCQAREEFFHASKFYKFIIERGGRVRLRAIDAPQVEWESPLAVFEATLVHERQVTSLIHNLVNLAKAETDHASDIFLQWFVTEQVEEEASADQVIQKLKLAGPGAGLFMIDQELAQRTNTPLVTGALMGTAAA